MQFLARLSPIILALVILAGASAGNALGQGSGTINQLEQWRATTTPHSAITTNVPGKNIYIPFATATSSRIYANVFCINNAAPDCITSWPSGGGGGSGTVGTSSSETATYIPFWTSTNGTPALLSGGSANFTFDNALGKLYFLTASTSNIGANSSAGIDIHSNSGAQVANFGAGGGIGSTFYGGVNIGGNLAVDTDVLYVNTTNNRVGIATTAPAYTLDAGGDINASSTYRVRGTQVIYLPNQTDFTGSLFYGNGGLNLSRTSGNDGRWNTGIGIGSMLANTTGNFNSAFGYNALEDNTTGTFNVAFGSNSLVQNTTGSNNLAIGYNALGTSLTNSSTVGVGTQAGLNVTGDSATFIGHQAGRAASTYSNTGATGVGFQALYTGTGNYSTAIGYRAGFLSTGATNLFLGYQAADNATTGANNIVIGNNIDAPSATDSNQLNIGNIIFGTGVSGTGTTIAGNIGIGTSTPGQLLAVAGNTYLTGGLGVGVTNTTAGSISATGNIQTNAGLINSFIGQSSFNGYNPSDNGARSGIAASNSFYIQIDSNNDQTDRLFAINTNSSNLSGGTELFRVQENGNVGIGTTTPTDKLSVSGNESNVAFTLAYGLNRYVRILSTSAATNFYGNSNVEFLRYDANSVSTVLAPTTGRVGVGTTTPFAKLSVRGDGTTTGVNFQTTNSSNNPLFTVLDSGNVGIGTTTPGTLLSIGSAADYINLSNTATSTFSKGINITSGCFAVNGVCVGGGSSNTFTYPLVNTAGTVSLAFGTTTANTWDLTQTFTQDLVVNGTATSTFAGNVQAVSQRLTGFLEVAGEAIFSSLARFNAGILLAANNYINFGTTTGSSGYGIRDNSGILQLKDSGSDWYSIPRIISNNAAVGGSTTNSATTTMYTVRIPANTIGTNGASLEIQADWSATVDDCYFEIQYGSGSASTSMAFSRSVQFRSHTETFLSATTTSQAYSATYASGLFGSDLNSIRYQTYNLPYAVSSDTYLAFRGRVTAAGTCYINRVTVTSYD